MDVCYLVQEAYHEHQCITRIEAECCPRGGTLTLERTDELRWRLVYFVRFAFQGRERPSKSAEQTFSMSKKQIAFKNILA